MTDHAAILLHIRKLAERDQFKITQHAQQEMVAESILMDDVLDAIQNATVIENYPDHRRGACCLLYGRDHTARDIHIVCTTVHPTLIIITVYLPLPPRWITPTQRSTTT